MASLNTTVAQLEMTFRALRQRWESTCTVWNDPVCWDFEKTYWTPLEQQVAATQREMERLAQVIAQARRNVK